MPVVKFIGHKRKTYFRSKATKARQVQSRLKSLEKMEKIDLPRTTKRVKYSFPEPPRSGQEVIKLENINKSYGENVVYQEIETRSQYTQEHLQTNSVYNRCYLRACLIYI